MFLSPVLNDRQSCLLQIIALGVFPVKRFGTFEQCLVFGISGEIGKNLNPESGQVSYRK